MRNAFFENKKGAILAKGA